VLISITNKTSAQNQLVTDQNPRYEESRSKYMTMSDSINTWHSTTSQETYRAIDYLADKAEAREQRKAFRRELRLERARNGYGWYNDYSYYPAVRNGYYNNGYNYHYNSSFYSRPYRSNYLWNSLPLAFAIGWCWR
jgi:hypothetical protein